MTFEEYAAKYPYRRHTCKFIVNLLADRQRNLPDIAAACRLHRDYIRTLLRSMEAAHVVYVAKWERSGRTASSPWRQVWAKGSLPSLPIPRLNEEERKEQERQRSKRTRDKRIAVVNVPKPRALWDDLLALAEG